MRLLFVAAAVKVAAGIAVSPWISDALLLPAQALPSWYYVLLLTAFGVSGVLLHLGGRHDDRARVLGVVLLLFATLFTDRLIARALPSLSASLAVLLAVTAAFHVNAFSPYALWRFAWVFPRLQPGLLPSWFPRTMTLVTIAAGLLFAFGDLVLSRASADGGAAGSLHARLSPNSEAGWFYQASALLAIPSLVLLGLKLRAAAADERRRLAWVVAGIIVGSSPMVVHVFLATVVSRYALWVAEPSRTRAMGIALTAFSLAIPASAAYAVVVDRVLEVRFVVRRAVQYLLARYTVLALMAGLLLGLASLVYQHRNRPLVEILGDSPVAVAGLVVVVIMFFWRRPLLEGIDRRFFREHYDANKILVELVDKSQQAQTTRDIVRLITGEVDRALHLERVALLLRDDDSGQLRDPEGLVRSLESEGALGSLIAGSRSPLDVDLSSESSVLGRLPDAEREWLADANARLIVPLFGAENTPLGVLTLGEKRSELPFTPEDRKLMLAVAASAALSIEQRRRHESSNPDIGPSVRTHSARQCVVCGRVQDRQQSVCLACGNPVEESLLPAVLAGKFEIERQIGAGGMGVVYRARDLSLDRPVAIKVLPRVVPQAASRLRREARAMATMQHPHLAVIHALESWRGAPVLVLEYLPGGTLADRIRFGPLPIETVVNTGVLIGDVLHHVHRAGYLHRDVKPSNIGYTERGMAKLLDFGLVRLVDRLSEVAATSDSTVTGAFGVAPAAPVEAAAPSFETGVHQFVGTPAYLSPEAIMAAPPGQGVDLWGLAVTMYEALTGRNPFSAPTVPETLGLIARTVVPDPRGVRPDCPDALAAFFAAALSADRSHRPQSASEFVARLREIRAGTHPDPSMS